MQNRIVRNASNVSLFALALSASNLLVTSSARGVIADPVFAAGGAIQFNGEPGLNPISQSTPTSTGLVTQSQDTAQGSYLASASPGVLHGLSHASLSSGAAPSTVSVISTAYITINDLVFTSSSPTINTSLNLSVDGLLSSTGDNGSSSAVSDVVIGYRVFDDKNVYSNDTSTFVANGDESTQSGFGSSPTISPSGTTLLTTTEFSVPPNVPLSLTLSLHTEANVSPSFSNNPFVGPADADADFSNTLTFNADGPVFNNPDNVPGFTVNSPSGGIVLNAATYVPEPGSLGLIGLATLFSLRRPRESNRKN